jgi:hypothetical protein
MVQVSARLAAALARRFGRSFAPATLIVDAPPAAREVEFRLQVRDGAGGPESGRWRDLAALSPVVRSLAHEQFDDLVKRVRVFAEPDDAKAIAGCGELDRLLLEASAV